MTSLSARWQNETRGPKMTCSVQNNLKFVINSRIENLVARPGNHAIEAVKMWIGKSLYLHLGDDLLPRD